MNIEVTLDELKTISNALWAYQQGKSELIELIDEMIEQQTVIDELDFDDCAGGACRL